MHTAEYLERTPGQYLTEENNNENPSFNEQVANANDTGKLHACNFSFTLVAGHFICTTDSQEERSDFPNVNICCFGFEHVVHDGCVGAGPPTALLGCRAAYIYCIEVLKFS